MDLSKEYIKMCDCPEIQDLWSNEKGNFMGDTENEPIWLPRQDQLQEMIYKGECMFDRRELLDKFREFCLEFETSVVYQEPIAPGWAKHPSYEQLWLVFVMWEKHRMTWTGSEWDRAHWTEEELEKIKSRVL